MMKETVWVYVLVLELKGNEEAPIPLHRWTAALDMRLKRTLSSDGKFAYSAEAWRRFCHAPPSLAIIHIDL